MRPLLSIVVFHSCLQPRQEQSTLRSEAALIVARFKTPESRHENLSGAPNPSMNPACGYSNRSVSTMWSTTTCRVCLPIWRPSNRPSAKLRVWACRSRLSRAAPQSIGLFSEKMEGNDQVEDYKRAIGRMGQLGIQVLCYNFMPQITDDAMVIRTSFEHPTRGGALTSCFRREAFDRYPLPHKEKSTTDEEMWDNLEFFLRHVVPAAEEAGVLLAMHPDDPPISPLCGPVPDPIPLGGFRPSAEACSKPCQRDHALPGLFCRDGSGSNQSHRAFQGKDTLRPFSGRERHHR